MLDLPTNFADGFGHKLWCSPFASLGIHVLNTFEHHWRSNDEHRAEVIMRSRYTVFTSMLIDIATMLLWGSWSRLLEVYFPFVTYIIWVSTPGQGWMWWRKSRRRTALRQRRPVSSRCRRWWGGREWNHNMCWSTIWGHAIVASCCINIISIIRYQLSVISIISIIISTIMVIRTDKCPKYCWRFVSLHLPKMKAPSFSILFLSTYFPQDCGELPVEWADFFAWRKSKTALYS